MRLASRAFLILRKGIYGTEQRKTTEHGNAGRIPANLNQHQHQEPSRQISDVPTQFRPTGSPGPSKGNPHSPYRSSPKSGQRGRCLQESQFSRSESWNNWRVQPMTIAEIAQREGVTERSAQRYITVGYKGTKLPAVKLGRTYLIALEDYRAWRLQCGFDFLPQQDAMPEAPKVSQGKLIAPPADPAVLRPYPPYPQPADSNGQLTTTPHPHSRNMPHPQACADYIAEQARKLKARLRGHDDTDN